ncbi:MAG TPA: zinc-ribbon and DUF3426 domain-containing protein [Rubrivivax sp.]|nr:zinc-ribbon and DUF3426 domain-containing protein [Rubrivivax sp.]
MTLATRCPNCRTVFKVVQDQLRISEGWVRCGRCAEVFNAVEHLVDAEAGEMRRAPIEVHRAFTPPVAPGRRAEPGAGDGPGPAGHAGDAPTVESAAGADAASDTQAGAPQAAAAPAESAPADLAAGERPVPAPAPAPAPGVLPSFVRSAERAERWQRPRMRALLSSVLLVAVLLLAAQWLYVYRDLAAARWPALRPLLVQACGALGCRIEPMRAIDSMSVDSSGLVRVEKSDIYRLAVALRNQGRDAIALPAVDLTLTDAQGRLIARRVLRASELGATAPTLAANSELALQGSIQVSGAPVAGYTIELFYP